jgi:hypothetical protein
MIDQILKILGDGTKRFKDHPQLIMTMLLIVTVPVAFLVSGQQFLSASRDNQERLEKDRIGILHDVFVSMIKAVAFDPQSMQQEIEYLAAHNPDITKFRIAREEGTEIRIVASLDVDKLNTLSDSPNTYRIGNTAPNETLISPYAVDGIRYWQSFRLVRVPGYPDYYIFVETSLEQATGSWGLLR